MKKLYALKGWFSLSDAAGRLSAGLGEQVTVADILQLVIEGHLPLSLYFLTAPALRVAPYTALYGRGFSTDFIGMLERFCPENKPPQDMLITSMRWECLDEDESILYLEEGPYRLELECSDALRGWVYGKLTNTLGELISPGELFVSDNEGTFWQIMEHQTGYSYRTPEGEEEKIESSYLPASSFPDKAELIIQRADIEIFENSLADQPSTKAALLLPRAETSYLNIIAALLEVIAKGIPSSYPEGGEIGPAAEFRSEAKLIIAIDEYYLKVEGLSQSNLQNKFRNARRSLKNCS